jgi:hypothetical protein
MVGGSYATADDCRWLEKQLNEKLTNGERIVHVEFRPAGVIVITEDLGLGPRQK